MKEWATCIALMLSTLACGQTPISHPDQITDLDGDYILTSDVFLVGEWDPIGDLESPFTGTFNGDGHFIVGLASHRDEFVGMFGVTDGNAVIANVTLVAPQVSGRQNVGPLVGKAFNSFIHDAWTVNARVEHCFELTARWAGGLIGHQEFTNVVNSGAIKPYITAVERAGGISGVLHGSQVGGVVAYKPVVHHMDMGNAHDSRRLGGLYGYHQFEEGHQDVAIDVLVIEPDILAEEQAGGLFGWIEQELDLSRGLVVGGQVETTGFAYRPWPAGGLVGYAQGRHGPSSIERCAVIDTHVVSRGQSGGIFGLSAGYTIRQSYADALVEIVPPFGNAATPAAGGLVGLGNGYPGPDEGGEPTMVIDCVSHSEIIGPCVALGPSGVGGFAYDVGHEITRTCVMNGACDPFAQGQFSATGSFYAGEWDAYETVPYLDDLTDPSPFMAAGWDFTSTWQMTAKGPEPQDLPTDWFLRGDWNGSGTVDVTDLIIGVFANDVDLLVETVLNWSQP